MKYGLPTERIEINYLIFARSVERTTLLPPSKQLLMKTNILLKIALLLALMTLSSCRVIPVGGRRPMGPPMGFNGMNQEGRPMGPPVGFDGTMNQPGAYPSNVGGQGRQKVSHGIQGYWAQKMTNGQKDGPAVWISGATAPQTFRGVRATVDQSEVSMPSADLDAILAKYRK